MDITPNSPLRLSIVIPTFNESGNVSILFDRIKDVLEGVAFEIVFVDDDSPDGTADVVREIAKYDYRIRCLQRIGRRGLSAACIEGMLSTSSPVIAVMDGDLQHDESLLPKMLEKVENEGVDVVVGTRYAGGGSTGEWNESRKIMSRIATIASRAVMKHPVSDPMSGFFMMKRSVLHSTVRRLSALGFKILVDILCTAKHMAIRIDEISYIFRERKAGESKLDELVIWEYGMLLADKAIGRFIPVRFFAFAIIGCFGVLVHFLVLAAMLKGFSISFTISQSIATSIAMIFNFSINNILTYRDKRLKGLAWIKGLLSFMIACSIGAMANVGVASYIFENETQWISPAVPE